MTDQPSVKDIVRSATAAALESDLGRWLSSGARLLAVTRQRLAAAEHAYATGRAKIIADAERELAAFRQATRDKLHEFEEEQTALIEQLQAEVARIEMMQEVRR